MKKIFLSFMAASLMLVPLASLALTDAETKAAADSIMPTNDGTFGEGLNDNKMVNKPIIEVISTVADYVIGILLLVAVFYVLWAAYTFMTSAGEAEKVGQARQRILYAGIGVVVALLAKGIVSLVLNAVNPAGGG